MFGPGNYTASACNTLRAKTKFMCSNVLFISVSYLNYIVMTDCEGRLFSTYCTEAEQWTVINKTTVGKGSCMKDPHA